MLVCGKKQAFSRNCCILLKAQKMKIHRTLLKSLERKIRYLISCAPSLLGERPAHAGLFLPSLSTVLKLSAEHLTGSLFPLRLSQNTHSRIGNPSVVYESELIRSRWSVFVDKTHYGMSEHTVVCSHMHPVCVPHVKWRNNLFSNFYPSASLLLTTSTFDIESRFYMYIITQICAGKRVINHVINDALFGRASK